jgi:hypothetical protein
MSYYLRFLSLVVGSLLAGSFSSPVYAWYDHTHMAVVEASGAPGLSYLAVGADMAKEKASNERFNHYSNNPHGTVKTVLDQAVLYNSTAPDTGHLYGAIIAALDSYRERKKDPTKYALYPLGYAMHYLGDLSMPFHNIDYNDFNRVNHARNDGVVDGELRLVSEIHSRMGKYATKINPLKFRESLATHVAQLANRSTVLGYQLQGNGTVVMSKDTAYEQLAQSAALLRAILVVLDLPVSP